MTIRIGNNDDLPAIQAIVRDVVREMEAQGNLQWDATYPDEARFAQDIANDALYVVDEAGTVAGFVVVDQEEPDGYRPLPWSGHGPALVIHRLAVASQSRSLGIASAIETFVGSLARERGISQLKTDTYSSNTGMQTFLNKKGYRKVGEMSFHGKELPFYCYEKTV